MTDLSAFPITRRWPPRRADAVQLYGFPTPNGRKVAIMLEETGLPYDAHRVTLDPADVKSEAFTSLNPNGRIPAILDPTGPDGRPVALFESGAILLYLGEKAGRFLGRDAAERAHVTAWLMWQMGGLGPATGRLGWLVRGAGRAVADPRPRRHAADEVRRLLGVLDGALEGRAWIAGDYSVADMAIAPWLDGLEMYGAREIAGWDGFANLAPYLHRFRARPAVARGWDVPPRAG
ncbi:glutathione S-transferase family protein [Jannaschia sp. W003]|uniref:glutathione S-transferase family protein n=1 Tax=Jannaschia sp. W003 TaxID=2867012 RepID=UPI0021A53214|nr:glutathione S-transferase N-terminal domain-containing protein [Jannaschia sp. W003]UWQ21418.1 glutathione S-transferase N-terminal domain-containing protein [Jannaschia sp. W003]